MTSTNTINIKLFLKNIVLVNIVLEIEEIDIVGKGGAGKPEDPSNHFLKILTIRSISIKKHGRHLVMLGQYLSKNMN